MSRCDGHVRATVQQLAGRRNGAYVPMWSASANVEGDGIGSQWRAASMSPAEMSSARSRRGITPASERLRANRTWRVSMRLSPRSIATWRVRSAASLADCPHVGFERVRAGGGYADALEGVGELAVERRPYRSFRDPERAQRERGGLFGVLGQCQQEMLGFHRRGAIVGGDLVGTHDLGAGTVVRRCRHREPAGRRDRLRAQAGRAPGPSPSAE